MTSKLAVQYVSQWIEGFWTLPSLYLNERLFRFQFQLYLVSLMGKISSDFLLVDKLLCE